MSGHHTNVTLPREGSAVMYPLDSTTAWAGRAQTRPGAGTAARNPQTWGAALPLPHRP